MPPTTAVSAPGKVFLAGGYLVLDRAYTALVFGLSARIHILVEDVQDGVSTGIVVQSPQFREATWRYHYQQAEEKTGGITVTQRSSSISRNPFVETTLAYTLSYLSTISTTQLKPIKITILADNDYYSQPSTTTTTSSSRFTDFAVPLSAAHKTGLGSSAALVTSLTFALLKHFTSSPPSNAVLHNLAQASHCAAQGKVGSGFDVAVATYGTCKYRRFSPSILSSLGEVGSQDFVTRLKAVVENHGEQWDTECEKGIVTIPEGMALVMCDVDCGSHTPSMVKKVLKWCKADPVGSKKLMDDLQSCNDNLERELASPQAHMGKLGEAFAAIRERIREMGEKSGVPIEPKEQTELLDAVTREVGGVVGGVVPGAGGYDAIVLLVRDDGVTRLDLILFLSIWSSKKGSNVRLLETKGELEGARVEDVKHYEDAFMG